MLKIMIPTTRIGVTDHQRKTNRVGGAFPVAFRILSLNKVEYNFNQNLAYLRLPAPNTHNATQTSIAAKIAKDWTQVYQSMSL